MYIFVINPDIQCMVQLRIYHVNQRNVGKYANMPYNECLGDDVDVFCFVKDSIGFV